MHHMGYTEYDDIQTLRQQKIAFNETPDRFRCLCRRCNTNIEWYYEKRINGMLEHASEVAGGMMKYRKNGLSRKEAMFATKLCAECGSVITAKGRWRACSEECRLKIERQYINQRDKDTSTYIKISCPVCGNKFTKTDISNQKTCGNATCKKKFTRLRVSGSVIAYKCVICGGVFETTANSVKKTCSEACSLTRKRQNVNLYDRSKNVYVECNCPICGDSFTITSRQVQKTCGKSGCMREYQVLRVRGSKITRNCVLCDSSFETTEKSTTKTCSKSCSKIWRSESRKIKRRTLVNKRKHVDMQVHTPQLTNSDLHARLGGRCYICSTKENLATHHMGYEMGDKSSPVQKQNAMIKDPDRFTCLCVDCNTHIEWYYERACANSLKQADKIADDMRKYRENGLTRKDTKQPKKYCVECTTLITKNNRWRYCSDECRLKHGKIRNKELVRKIHTHVKGMCPICGMSFRKTTRQQQRTCGNIECRQKLTRQEKIGLTISRDCCVCNMSFKTTPNALKKTCSKKCSKEHARRMAHYYRDHVIVRETKTCPICDIKFTKTTLQHQKTCGKPECTSEWTRLYLSGKKINKQCAICGIGFVIAGNANKTTCSKKCRSVMDNEIRRTRRQIAVLSERLN